MVIIMYNDLNNIFEEMSKAFEDVYKGIKNNINVDIIKNEDSYQVLASLPGVKKENIKLSCENSKLTISVNEETKENDKKYILNERINGYNPRTIVLKNMDEKSIKASLENGVLSIVVPFAKNQTTNIVID
jgi:HSP20 family protein